MDFRILGSLEALNEQGPVALGGMKPRAVLAFLLLHLNQPVSSERLAVALWGEDAPASAVKTVRTDGWSWHANLAGGKPGDLVLYTEPKSNGTAAHVELLVSATPFDVIGGNTSADPSTGNQSNGGCVAEHHRDPHAGSLHFKGYARPPWTR